MDKFTIDPITFIIISLEIEEKIYDYPIVRVCLLRDEENNAKISNLVDIQWNIYMGRNIFVAINLRDLAQMYFWVSTFSKFQN